MTNEEIDKLVVDLIHGDYNDIVFTTTLFEMFGKRVEDVAEYIKPGREFWYFENFKWRKLKVTYVRTGVMFFTFEDEPSVEKAWYIGSYAALTLSAAQIYPNEIAKILAKTYPNNNFAEACKQCKWDDHDGQIKVEVIWNEED